MAWWWKRCAVLATVVGAGCAGRSVEHVSEDGTRGTDGSGAGTSGQTSTGGTGATGGTVSQPTHPGTGAQTGAGATSPNPAGSSGKNAEGGIGAAAGEGGSEPGSSGCSGYQQLPGSRCALAEAYGQGLTFEIVKGAVTLDDCVAACNARPDCTAVSDYLDLRPELGCYTTTADCSNPVTPVWAEEDGGQLMRRYCDTGIGCDNYEPLGTMRCDEGNSIVPVRNATSANDCYAACNADPACTGIVDYFFLSQVAGQCFLNIRPCVATVKNFEDGTLYLKCGG